MTKQLKNFEANSIDSQLQAKITGGALDRNYLRRKREKSEPSNPSKGGTLTKRPIPKL
ncbi:MAG: hypothetical protein AAFQ94_01030 [Bacteroidota bacterium]